MTWPANVSSLALFLVPKDADHCCGLRQSVGRCATNQNCGKGEEVGLSLANRLGISKDDPFKTTYSPLRCKH